MQTKQLWLKKMTDDNNKYKNIDEYIAQFSPEIRRILENIRQVVREASPGSIEKISYGIPTLWFNGNLVHFAAYKKHIGFYPGETGIETFKDKLSGYKWSRGTVQFQLDKEIPYELIREIARYKFILNSVKKD